MSLRGLVNKQKESPAERPTDVLAVPASVPSPAPIPRPARRRVPARLAAWIDTLQRDPTADDRAALERRALLLEELNRTVADSPDDVPIKYVIDRLNRHWDD